MLEVSQAVQASGIPLAHVEVVPASGASGASGGAGAGSGGASSVVKRVRVSLPSLDVVEGVPAVGELALKLVLNAITTGAHVRRGNTRRVAAIMYMVRHVGFYVCLTHYMIHATAGTVYKNRMINLMVTNRKLFHRAAGIVATFSGVSREQGWFA